MEFISIRPAPRYEGAATLITPPQTRFRYISMAFDGLKYET